MESEEKQCYVVCSNKKCGETFYVPYAEAVRSYQSTARITCPRCHKSSVFDLLTDAHIIEKAAE